MATACETVVESIKAFMEGLQAVLDASKEYDAAKKARMRPRQRRRRDGAHEQGRESEAARPLPRRRRTRASPSRIRSSLRRLTRLRRTPRMTSTTRTRRRRAKAALDKLMDILATAPASMGRTGSKPSSACAADRRVRRRGLHVQRADGAAVELAAGGVPDVDEAKWLAMKKAEEEAAAAKAAEEAAAKKAAEEAAAAKAAEDAAAEDAAAAAKAAEERRPRPRPPRRRRRRLGRSRSLSRSRRRRPSRPRRWRRRRPRRQSRRRSRRQWWSLRSRLRRSQRRLRGGGEGRGGGEAQLPRLDWVDIQDVGSVVTSIVVRPSESSHRGSIEDGSYDFSVDRQASSKAARSSFERAGKLQPGQWAKVDGKWAGPDRGVLQARAYRRACGCSAACGVGGVRQTCHAGCAWSRRRRA